MMALGWSFGGVLAFEASRQLRKAGIVVKGVILIDSPFPIGHQALPSEVISYIVKKPANGRGVISEAARKARGIVQSQFQRHARMLEQYDPEASAADVPCVEHTSGQLAIIAVVGEVYRMSR